MENANVELTCPRCNKQVDILDSVRGICVDCNNILKAENTAAYPPLDNGEKN